MNIRALLCGAAVALGLGAAAGPAAADIFITTPPSPILPAGEPLVQQPAPVDVFIIFGLSPGPPNVSVNPGPPN